MYVPIASSNTEPLLNIQTGKKKCIVVEMKKSTSQILKCHLSPLEAAHQARPADKPEEADESDDGQGRCRVQQEPEIPRRPGRRRFLQKKSALIHSLLPHNHPCQLLSQSLTPTPIAWKSSLVTKMISAMLLKIQVITSPVRNDLYESSVSFLTISSLSTCFSSARCTVSLKR